MVTSLLILSLSCTVVCLVLVHMRHKERTAAVEDAARRLEERSAKVFADLPTVKIDASGGRKYVVCTVELPGHEPKRVVRAHRRAMYHVGIVDMLAAEIANTSITIGKVRGGYIVHEPDAKRIYLSGESQGYGKDDSRFRTAELLKSHYPDYRIGIED